MVSLFENNERKYYSLCEDWTFHYVFSKDTEESRQALMGLLNVILDRRNDPIVKVKILNPVHYSWKKTGKNSVLDIKAEASSGELINIEMQNRDLQHYRNRSLKYGARLVNSSLEKGQEYDKMKKSIVISLTAGILFPELAEAHNVFRIQNVKQHDEEDTVLMTDRLEFHFLELGKIDGKKPVAEMTEVEKVAAYLKYAGDEKHEAYTQDLLREGGDAIAMMEYVFKELTADDIAREIRFSEEMAEHDRATLEAAQRRREEAIQRKEAENQRKEAENQRKEAENQRKEAENQRKEVELKRKEAELDRKTQELEQKIQAAAEERVNHLNRLLIETGRTDDLVKAAMDADYQLQLFGEFGL